MTLALALPHSIIVVPLILNSYSTPVVVSIPKCETKEGISVLKIKTVYFILNITCESHVAIF